MTKENLIFDWRKSEGSGKDKLFAFLLVTMLFTFFAGFLELHLPSFRSGAAQGAEMIRFADGGMGHEWLLEAEENGPFPGRLAVEWESGAAMIPEGSGLDAWTDYRVGLLPLPEEKAVGRAEITSKGKRVFPTIPGASSDVAAEDLRLGEIQRIPILIPYDRFAREWMPEETPNFALPSGAEIVPDSLRYAVSLREDGGVAEVIPLAGGPDPVQEAVERWLRGVRFKDGDGERWFGLRVDFLNRRENVTEPE